MKIGLLVHFPNSPAGENETLCRFEESISLLGMESIRIPIDRNDLTYSAIIEIEKTVDLIIDIHFTFPRFFRTPTIGLLWTPLTYMEGWGLAGVLPNLFSSSYLISTGDNQLKRLALSWRPELKDLLITDLPLNHSLPTSWVVPEEFGRDWKNAALFYTGINWDKLSNSRGRHHDVLQLLDKKGILRVYGPEKLLHVKPWEGYSGYMGEIPFDGRTILDVASKCGVFLAWSSEGHINENIMSNRLFEAIASNCIIIADNHPFIQNALGDLAFYIDFSRSLDLVVDDVETVLSYVRNNPEEMNQRVDTQRRVFFENFALEKQLSSIFQTFQKPISAESPLIRIAVHGKKEKFLSNNSWLPSRVSVDEISNLKDGFSLNQLLNSDIPNLTESWVFFASEDTQISFDALTSIELLIQNFPNKQLFSLSGIVIAEGSNKFNPYVVTLEENFIPLQGLLVSSNLIGLAKWENGNSINESIFLSSSVVVWRLENASEVYLVKIQSQTDSLYNKVRRVQEIQNKISIRDAKSELIQKLSLPHSSNLIDKFFELQNQQKRRFAVLLVSSLPGFNFVRPYLRFIYRWMYGIFIGKR